MEVCVLYSCKKGRKCLPRTILFISKYEVGVFSVCVFLTTHVVGGVFQTSPSVAVAGPLESLNDFAVYLTVDFNHVVCVWSVS